MLRYPVHTRCCKQKISDNLLSYVNANKANYYMRRAKENLTDFEIACLGYDWEKTQKDIIAFRNRGFSPDYSVEISAVKM